MREALLAVGCAALLMLVGCASGPPVRPAGPPPGQWVAPGQLPPPPVPNEDEPPPPLSEQHAPPPVPQQAAYPTPIIHVRMHAIVTASDDGTEQSEATLEGIMKAVQTTNAYYQPAGIYFEFDPRTDFEIRRDTLMNYDCVPVSRGGPTPRCDDRANKQQRQYVAQSYPNKMVVIFRSFNNNLKWDAATGWKPGRATGGFSGKGMAYVVVGPGSSGGTYLAHEIGHYLHLDHPFVTSVMNVQMAADRIRRYVEEGRHPMQQGLLALDGDQSSVSDTPPDAAGTIFLSVGLTPCGEKGEIPIPVTFSNGAQMTYTLAPNRHNIMSYFKNCPFYHDFSPQQIARMRDALLRGNRRNVVQGLQ